MLDKKKILASFNRAAPQYDAVAHFQRQVAQDLLALLPQVSLSLENILDIGCGTGFVSQCLANQFPAANIVAIDFAQNMLVVAQQKIKQKNILWLGADVDQLPLRNANSELIVSNLMLQWAQNIADSLSELQRNLTTGGYLLFSTFAPGSLDELNQSWQKVDAIPRIHSFMPQANLTQITQQLNFEIISWQQKQYTLHYPDALTLMQQLKMLGASNAQHNRPKNLQTATRLKAAIMHYEHFRNAEGLLPASYYIYFGLLRKK